MGGTCSPRRGVENAYKILIGKPEWKSSFARHRHKWEGNIKMDFE
jgi:hypothetical protein